MVKRRLWVNIGDSWKNGFFPEALALREERSGSPKNEAIPFLSA